MTGPDERFRIEQGSLFTEPRERWWWEGWNRTAADGRFAVWIHFTDAGGGVDVTHQTVLPDHTACNIGVDDAAAWIAYREGVA